MERPWTDAGQESLSRLPIDPTPMSQDEALEIVKAIALKYAIEQRPPTQLADWVAGCTDDFDG